MNNQEINIRDPFVLPYRDSYYLYGTRGATCWGPADGFDVYVGKDLEHWSGPIEIFHNDGSFWADQNYWAPEVYPYEGAFYLFASFKSDGACRGTQILRAEQPEGSFVPISDGPVTPRDWECLDGTFYLDKEGNPWMVFCHEWLQVRDGEICALPLSRDLTRAAGEPRLLFRASEARSWIVPVHTPDSPLDNYVTDGPFLYRCRDGALLLLWSSSGAEGYTQAVARSDNGEITGNWIQQDELLFRRDGGHGMVFHTFDGRLMLALHSPNETPLERPRFFELEDTGNRLRLKR